MDESATRPAQIAPLFQAKDLRLRGADGLIYGPLDLIVRPGEATLVVCRDLEIIRRLMRCCQAFDRPDSGRLTWWPEAASRAGITEWRGYDFFRQIGYVDRQSQLIHQLPLRENLHLFHLYAGRADGRARAAQTLEALGLTGQADTLAENLSEPLRRLALYALALNQSPRLMLLERPVQFLDQDFDLVWDIIMRQCAERGLAVVVFDRTRTVYAAETFRTAAAFAPGPPSL